MLYPIVVHKEKNTHYGISIPDFPSCFTAADTQEQISVQVQHVVSEYMEGKNYKLPKPSKIEDVAKQEDLKNGFVMLVHIKNRD